jgi:hypothetical protein
MLLHHLFESIVQPNAGVVTHLLTNLIRRMIAGYLDREMQMDDEFSQLWRVWREKLDDWGNEDRGKDRDAISSYFYNHIIQKIDRDASIIKDMKNRIERELQNFSRDYIENIEFNTKDGKKKLKIGLSNIDETRNVEKVLDVPLYWLQHIIVELKISNSNIDDISKKGGGYFDRYPRNIGSDHEYANAEYNPKNQFAVHIVIYSEMFKWREMIHEEMTRIFDIELYGESSEGNNISKFTRPMVSTFLHELTHLEQDTRARVRNPYYRSHGITYTPNPTKPRQVAVVRCDPPRKPKRRTLRQTR